jgi:predicted GNAT family acetyltransferase
MSESVESERVSHDRDKCRFVLLSSSEGKETSAGLLDYARLADGSLELFHTEVDPSFRGRGVAKRLADAAVAELLKDNAEAKLVMTCSYLKHAYSQSTDNRITIG